MQAKQGRSVQIVLRTIVLIFLGLGTMACTQGSKQDENYPPIKVAQPLVQNIDVWDQYSGRFKAVDKVDIQARVNGYLTSINFTDGQLVKKGDLLFVIDQRPFQIAVQTAQSDLQKSQAALILAEKDFNRVKELYERKVLPIATLDEKQNNYSHAVADVEAKKAALNKALLDLSYTEIEAPINGRISENYVSIGSLVIGGGQNATLLTSITSQDPIYFYFDMSESDYLRLAKQYKIKLSLGENYLPAELKLLDEPQFVHQGKVDFFDNSLDTRSATLRARARFPNPDGLLQPGEFGIIRILSAKNNKSLLIPENIITQEQDKKFVYVLTKDNTLERREITLDKKLENFVIVASGLNQDDWVATNRLHLLHPGMKIKPDKINFSPSYKKDMQ